MKGRLGQAALPAMKVALAREQSFAEQPLRPLQRAALRKILLVSDEHVLDVIRVVEKVNVLWPHPEIGDVAVLREALDEIDGIAAEAYEIQPKEFAFRAGGKMGVHELSAP